MCDGDLIQKLRLAESDLLTSLLGGTRMLASYRQSWSALPGELFAASRDGSIGQETLSLAHLVATRISKIAGCFLDIKRYEESATAQLLNDCDSMLQQMGLLSLDTQLEPSQLGDIPSPPAAFPTPTPAPPTETSNYLFISSAYGWLLDNLHNPYPSAEVKTRVAATSSCQVSSVNSWFANARRRIGWTTLCREHFSNCRADMIDAAYRALVKEDPQRELSIEVKHAFVTMKVVAENLYASTFARTAFAEDLSAILRDKSGDSIEVVGRHRVESASLTKAAQDSYPSPDRSTTTSPTTSPASAFSDSLPSEREDVAVPSISSGSKRRRLSIDTADQPSPALGRPTKRLRSAPALPVAHLPSPPSSTNGSDTLPDSDLSALSLGQTTQPETDTVTSSRKRRLSGSESVGVAKRPCTSMAVPVLHTTSDLLPPSEAEVEFSIDDWFNANINTLFDIPPPVDATEPDPSSSWEVELFRDYNIPESSNRAPADTLPAAPPDLSEFENLLQSIGSDASIAPSGTVPLSHPAGIPSMTSLDLPGLDFSQTNVDWTALFSDSNMYQLIAPTFPQHPTDSQIPLPEIDLSILQLPPAAPITNSQGDLALKQAKLDQLHAMQEAVRRMEQELQSEGILT